MHKLVINHSGKDIDFFLHDSTQEQGKKQANGLANIIQGNTYPIVSNLNPKIIIDIGANIGAASLFFAINYPKSKIYSFEPTKINFSLLQKNVGNFPNVTIIQKGIYDENKKQKIYINSNNPGTNSIYEKWRKFDNYEYANFIKLKDYLNENNIKNIDILKIDTEGCEVSILQSIKSLINQITVIYLEHHSEQQGLMIKNLLSTSHNIKKYSLSGVTKVSVNDYIVGMINYDNIFHDENIIIAKNQVVNKENLKELRKIGLSSIKIYSKQLGEICFVNKNLKVP